jgi:cytochrome c
VEIRHILFIMVISSALVCVRVPAQQDIIDQDTQQAHIDEIQDRSSQQPTQQPTEKRKRGLRSKKPTRPFVKIARNNVESTEAAQKVFEKGFDTAAKESSIIALVNSAIEYINTNSVLEACQAFSHDDNFVVGEVYLFMIDENGNELTSRGMKTLVWSDANTLKDDFGRLFFEEMLKIAKHGGGWLTYSWEGAIKSSYIKMTEKSGKRYLIGAGYYSHSKPDSVVNLVKTAVSMFNDKIKKNEPVVSIFSLINYPIDNPFVSGDLYLFALDFDGNIVAQGDRPGLVGTNALHFKDGSGKEANKEIIEKLKKSETGNVWVEYVSFNTIKHAYAEKVVDATGRQYFIAAGYYPYAKRDKVVELVKRGYQFMEGHGRTMASQLFTTRQDFEYKYGDLYLFVYDTKGNVIAHGDNEDWVGQNHFNNRDDEGSYYVREIIAQAQSGPGWLTFRRNNAFWSVYVEPISLGIEDYVIASGVYPTTKPETMMLMISSALSYFKNHTAEEAFRAFMKPKDDFTRGDLSIFVFDDAGLCYTWGHQQENIWKNLLNLADDDGRPYVKTFINTAKFGPGKVSFKLNRRQAIAHVERIEKEGRGFTIGSYYFT